MKIIGFLFFTLLSFNIFAASSVYISPLSVGVMNTFRSSGEPGSDSTLTVGGEVMLEKNQALFGLRYDHIEKSWEGDAVMGVRNKMDLLLLEVGYKFLTAGSVSPYIFTGGGAFFQTVYSRMLGNEEANSTIMFGYKVGLGLLVDLTNNWNANLAVHYYPQSFVNSFNYVLSAGFVL